MFYIISKLFNLKINKFKSYFFWKKYTISKNKKQNFKKIQTKYKIKIVERKKNGKEEDSALQTVFGHTCVSLCNALCKEKSATGAPPCPRVWCRINHLHLNNITMKKNHKLFLAQSDEEDQKINKKICLRWSKKPSQTFGRRNTIYHPF